MPPSLAWEVIESIIDYLQDDIPALRSCALTCCHLRPRARFHLLARLCIKRNDQLTSLVELLDAEPNLRCLVQSIAISLEDVVPLPLLILPNLFHWKFINRHHWYYMRPMTLHPSTILCCQVYGAHVQRLSFDRIFFVNSMAFMRALSAFPNIRDIVCRAVEVRANNDGAPLQLVKQRLIRQTRVANLSMGLHVDATAFGLLLEVVHNSMQHLDIVIAKSLVIAAREAVIRVPQELRFSHLHSLILRLPRKRHNTLHAIFSCTIGLLKNFATSVQEVTVEFSCYRGLHLLSSWLMRETNASLCKELETLLLRFALPTVSFSSPQMIRASRRSFWAGELGWYFPTLHRRGQVKILSKTTDEGPQTHDAAISVLTVSPDGKWVASGSADSTIILWDAERRLFLHEWVAHVGGVDRLAFSPSDGQFLASSGKDNAVTIWAVSAQDSSGVDVKCVIALREVERMWRVDLCGWAGDNLLFTSRTKTKAVVRTWNTKTATQRQLLAGGSIQVIPSQDDVSRFLVLSTRSDASILRAQEINRDMEVRHIGSLECHGCTSPPKNASCSSGGRLAIIHGDARVLVWDLEAGAPASARPPTELNYPGGNVQGIAVSPDGNQVLAWGGNSMTIWDAHDDFAAPCMPFEGHGDRIVTASFSPDGKTVASASKDGAVWLWCTLNGSRIATLTDHSDSVECVVFSPDGHLLLSGDVNGTVVIHLLRDIVLDR